MAFGRADMDEKKPVVGPFEVRLEQFGLGLSPLEDVQRVVQLFRVEDGGRFPLFHSLSHLLFSDRIGITGRQSIV